MFVTLEDCCLPDTCEPGQPHPQNKTSFMELQDEAGSRMLSQSMTGQSQPGTASSRDDSHTNQPSGSLYLILREWNFRSQPGKSPVWRSMLCTTCVFTTKNKTYSKQIPKDYYQILR